MKTKQSNPIETIAKLEWTQSSAQQNIEHNGSSTQQRINKNRTAALERTAAKASRGLKCILLVPNLLILQHTKC